jgi:hypothetical protein
MVPQPASASPAAIVAIFAIFNIAALQKSRENRKIAANAETKDWKRRDFSHILAGLALGQVLST